MESPHNAPSSEEGQLPRLRPPAPSPPPAPPVKKERTWLHLLLFVLTFVSATLPFATSVPGETPWEAFVTGPLTDPIRLLGGLSFSLPLMAILLAHEMGHYITARRYGVAQSLPFFIPAPGTFFGTMGAVIMIRSQPPSRPSLFNVAVMGPYAGMVLALPAAAWGLAHSTPVDPQTLSGSTIVFGSSLLFGFLETVFSPNGTDVFLHPTGLAGWVGFLITSLNLIPAGQLDGGHIAYALLGRYHTWFSRGVVMALMILAITLGADGLIWGVWAILLSLFGLRHPPVRDESIPLSGGQRFSALVALCLLVITFTPTPIKVTSTHDTPAPPIEAPLPPSPDLHEEFKL